MSHLKNNTLSNRSFSRDVLNEITNECCDNIGALLDELGVGYEKSYNRIFGPCPVHGGDNPAAWSLYPEGDTVRGFWVCRTRGCESKWKKTLIGFVHGVLSKDSNEEIPWTDAVVYMMKFLGYKSVEEIKLPDKATAQRKKISNISNGLNDCKKKVKQERGREKRIGRR